MATCLNPNPLVKNRDDPRDGSIVLSQNWFLLEEVWPNTHHILYILTQQHTTYFNMVIKERKGILLTAHFFNGF